MYDAKDFLQNLSTVINYSMRKCYQQDWSDTEEVFVYDTFSSMSYIVKAIDKVSLYYDDLELNKDKLNELLNYSNYLEDEDMKIETVRDLMKYLTEFNPDAKLTNKLDISWSGLEESDYKGRRDIVKEKRGALTITIKEDDGLYDMEKD